MTFPTVFLLITTLGLAIFLGALVVEHVRALDRSRHLTNWANAVLSTVQEHIDELEHNKARLTKDKGYGVSDDSSWQEEIVAFVRLTLVDRQPQAFRTPTAENQFIRFATGLVGRLLERPESISSFSLQEHIENFETDDKRWQSFQPIFRWGFAVIFLVIASQFVVSQAWGAAALTMLAGAVLVPLVYSRITLAAPWFARFWLGWLSALVLAVLALTAVATHAEHQRIEQEAIAAEQQHEEQLQADRKAQQEREKVEQKKKQEEELVRHTFATEHDQVIERLTAAIQEERFADAKAIIDKFSIVEDDSLTQLSDLYKAQKAVYDKRAAEEQAQFAKENAERERQKNYEQRIPADALDKYTSQGYPKLVAQYRSRLPEIEKLRRAAAEMAIDSGKCDYAENVQLSGESTLKSLKFFLDCKNGSRIYLTEAEIRNREPVKTQTEKAVDHSEAISQCKSMVRAQAKVQSQAMIPSSIDFHSILGMSVRTAPTLGNVIVSLDFDAKNAFNAEIGYTARCIFPPQKPGELEITVRGR